MENENRRLKLKNNREGERGAALVMVIMISFLLLVACGALLLESSMNTANVTDATAEQQAYYAAESGVQTALNVLRGNTSPVVTASTESGNSESGWAETVLSAAMAPLSFLETRASAQTSTTNEKIDFRKAVNLSTSNAPNDPSTVPRLSRWVRYNYTPNGNTTPDRVTVGTGTYNPQTGMAFSLEVQDPDNTSSNISFTTTGSFLDPRDGTWKSAITYGTGTDLVSVSYVPVSSTRSVNVSTGQGSTNVGNFVFQGNGASFTERVRFSIQVNMSSPYTAVREIRGWIEPAPMSTGTSVVILYDSPAYILMGSTITLTNPNGTGRMVSDPNATPVARYGYEITYTAGSIVNNAPIGVTMTQTEPTRLIVRAMGYGPRGAQKRLEVVVQKNLFDGLTAPATLTLVGGSSGFTFKSGNSQNVTYSGDDVITSVLIPPIGTTNDANLQAIKDDLTGSGRKTDIIGTPSNVTYEMPWWLQNTANLDRTIQNLKNIAQSSGRYYTAGQTPPNVGDNANARGITFVDGDLALSGAGGGLLIVTGKLTLNGGFDFNGMIIVTGSGGVSRSGGGNGELHGNMIIAPYDQDNVGAGFQSPKYDISGGGTSEVRYNSSTVTNGLTAISNFVQGVVEK